MELIRESAMTLAASADGNPVIATLVVMLFALMFGLVEATVEELVWGERFEHWLDPIFMCAFIAYAAYAVWACAVFNTAKAVG
jgi:hypothetical protein